MPETTILPWIIIDLVLCATADAFQWTSRAALDVAPDDCTPRVRRVAMQLLPHCHLLAATEADRTDLVARWLDYGLPITSTGWLPLEQRIAVLSRYASRHGDLAFLDMLRVEAANDPRATSLAGGRIAWESLLDASVANCQNVMDWWHALIVAEGPPPPPNDPASPPQLRVFREKRLAQYGERWDPPITHYLAIGPISAIDGAGTQVLDWWLDLERAYGVRCFWDQQVAHQLLVHQRQEAFEWWVRHICPTNAAQPWAWPEQDQFLLGTMAAFALLALLPLPPAGCNVAYSHAAVLAGMSRADLDSSMTWWCTQHRLESNQLHQIVTQYVVPSSFDTRVFEVYSVLELAATAGSVKALDWWTSQVKLNMSDFGKALPRAAEAGQNGVLGWAADQGWDVKRHFKLKFTVTELPATTSALETLKVLTQWGIGITVKDDVLTAACREGDMAFLDWLARSPLSFSIKAVDMDLVCERNHLHVLEWWSQLRRDLPRRAQFKYTHASMDTASALGYISIMSFWKDNSSSLPLLYTAAAIDMLCQNSDAVPALRWWQASGLELKYTAHGIDNACRFAHCTNALGFWKSSGLEIRYSARALDNATLESHIQVLQWWASSGLPLRVTQRMLTRARIHLGLEDPASLDPMETLFRVPMPDVLMWWREHFFSPSNAVSIVYEVMPDHESLQDQPQGAPPRSRNSVLGVYMKKFFN
ncbi:hypothetical protein BC828DRAFT_436013 [Blastocladiella britannica]|nr:hypothetical protein BC828DRAFT_436013 [Blastocladiella britannica]